MATFATFTRLKDKGLAALRAGDYPAAKPYLLQAAECMIELAEESKDEQQRADQESYAKELLDLAKDCDRKGKVAGRAGAGTRERARGAGGDEDEGPQAEDWVVREKPNVRFEDIAGLDEVKDEIRLKMLYPF